MEDLQHQALLGFPGDQQRSGGSSLEDAFPGIKAEGTLQVLRLCAVAGVAVFDQNGADRGLECLEPGGIGGDGDPSCPE